MHSFCTLFDSNYLTRGLALYESLQQTGEAFRLYIICMDIEVFEILKALDLADITLISLEEFENDALRRVKSRRTCAEYCWTCTPFVVGYCLNTFALERVTYVDADLYFFAKPSMLFDEFERSGASVLITEHRFPAAERKMLIYGIYCVQFITFVADVSGQTVLQWWQDRCLEWCHARVEGDKFGDQKYLDHWPETFSGVHVLHHLGGGVAPWNVGRYLVTGGPCVDGIDIVFYHFHYLRWYREGKIDVGIYRINKDVEDLIYRPYLGAIERQFSLVRAVLPDFDKGRDVHRKKWDVLRSLKRRCMGKYNVIEP